MSRPSEPAARRRLRVVLVLALALVGLPAAATTWVSLSHRAAEREIVAAVEQFQVPESWEVLVDDLEPARALCLGGNACPSARKDWRVPAPLTPLDMEDLLAAAGWNLIVDGDCQARDNVRGFGPVCSATGIVDGVYIYLAQSRDVERSDAQIQLFVDPAT